MLEGNICALLRPRTTSTPLRRGIVPDPEGIITAATQQDRPHDLLRRVGPINEPALTAMLREIIANNRAGGWRKIKAARGEALQVRTPPALATISGPALVQLALDGIVALKSGEGVSGSSWSQTKRKSITPVSIVACTPSTFQRGSIVRSRRTDPSSLIVPTTEPWISPSSSPSAEALKQTSSSVRAVASEKQSGTPSSSPSS